MLWTLGYGLDCPGFESLKIQNIFLPQNAQTGSYSMVKGKGKVTPLQAQLWPRRG